MGQRRRCLSLSPAPRLWGLHPPHPGAPGPYPQGTRGVAARGQWSGGPPGEGSWRAARLWRRCTACTSSDHACAPTKCALRAGGTLSVPAPAQRSGPSPRTVVMGEGASDIYPFPSAREYQGAVLPDPSSPGVCPPETGGIELDFSVSPIPIPGIPAERELYMVTPVQMKARGPVIFKAKSCISGLALLPPSTFWAWQDAGQKPPPSRPGGHLHAPEGASEPPWGLRGLPPAPAVNRRVKVRNRSKLGPPSGGPAKALTLALFPDSGAGGRQPRSGRHEGAQARGV